MRRQTWSRRRWGQGAMATAISGVSSPVETTSLVTSLYSSPKRETPHGWSMVGPFYPRELTEPRLSELRGLSVPRIHPIGPHLPDVAHRVVEREPQRIRARFFRELEALVTDDSIGAWYLIPEEARYYSVDEMEYLRIAAQAIREADPQHRPIVHYQANGRSYEELRSIVAAVDWPCVGVYTNHCGYRDRRAWVRWATAQVVRACEASKGRPGVVLEMFEDPRPDEVTLIPRWVRHDGFAALLSGARALVVFSGWSRPQFDAYGHYLSAYDALVGMLHGPHRLADSVVLGTRVPIVFTILRGPIVVDVAPNRNAPRRMRSALVHAYAHRGHRTIFAVNSTGRTLALRLHRIQRDAMVLLNDGEWDAGRRRLVLPAWGVAILRDGDQEFLRSG